jgi:hypothetical protein
MNKKPLIGVIVLIVIIVIIGISVTNKKDQVAPVATTDQSKKVYCSADGTLTSTESIQSHRSYCLKATAQTNYQPNAPVVYSFSIIDDQGNTLKDFALEHEKLLHLIVVRKDLKEFQHVHPNLNQSTGQFTLNDLIFPATGPYRIFADFTASGAQKDADGMLLNTVVYQDVNVGDVNSYTAQPLGTTEKNKIFNDYNVTLSTNPQSLSPGVNLVTFKVSQNGKPVTNLEDYLGALGHSVILKENTLDYIHTHALEDVSVKQTGKIDFHVEFPSIGNYKIFTQFKHNGKVITTDFVVTVSAPKSGAKPASNSMMMH